MLGTTAGYQQSYSEPCDLGGKKWVTSQFLFEESGKGIIICYTYHCLLWRPYEIISSEVFGNLSLHYVNTQTFTYLVIYVSLCFYFSSGFLPLLAYVIFKTFPILACDCSFASLSNICFPVFISLLLLLLVIPHIHLSILSLTSPPLYSQANVLRHLLHERHRNLHPPAVPDSLVSEVCSSLITWAGFWKHLLDHHI